MFILDEKCLEILSNCHKALSPNGKVVVVFIKNHYDGKILFDASYDILELGKEEKYMNLNIGSRNLM